MTEKLPVNDNMETWQIKAIEMASEVLIRAYENSRGEAFSAACKLRDAISEEANSISDDSPLNLWIVEWSPQQKRFHTHTMEDAIKNNLEVMLSGRRSDWIVVGFARNHEESHKVCRELKTIANGYVPMGFSA
jgi:hypothetical protein